MILSGIPLFISCAPGTREAVVSRLDYCSVDKLMVMMKRVGSWKEKFNSGKYLFVYITRTSEGQRATAYIKATGGTREA